MASAAVYPKYKEAREAGTVAVGTATVKQILVRSSTFNAAHTSVADLKSAGATEVARTAAVANKTYTAGVFSHDPTTFGTIATGAAFSAVVWITDPGTGDANCKLVAYDDTVGGLQNPPNGSEVTYTPPVNGVYGPTS